MEDEHAMEKRSQAVTILLEANERTRSTQASTADRQASIRFAFGELEDELGEAAKRSLTRDLSKRSLSRGSFVPFKKTVIAMEGERSSQFVSRVREGGDRGKDGKGRGREGFRI